MWLRGPIASLRTGLAVGRLAGEYMPGSRTSPTLVVVKLLAVVRRASLSPADVHPDHLWATGTGPVHDPATASRNGNRLPPPGRCDGGQPPDRLVACPGHRQRYDRAPARYRLATRDPARDRRASLPKRCRGRRNPDTSTWARIKPWTIVNTRCGQGDRPRFRAGPF